MTKTTFKLPNIFGATKPLLPAAAVAAAAAAPSPPSAQPKYAKISDMANAHLSTAKLSADPAAASPLRSNSINIMPAAGNLPRFPLPKLSGGSPFGSSPVLSAERLTPHEASLQKIMDLRRLTISGEGSPTGALDDSRVQTTYAQAGPAELPVEPLSAAVVAAADELEAFSVDLTSALNKPGTAGTAVPAPIRRAAEPIDFQFIDCDTSERPAPRPIVTKDCCLDISGIMADALVCRTKRTTAFGRVLCSRYSRRVKPFVVHGFKNKHQIKPFSFETVASAIKQR